MAMQQTNSSFSKRLGARVAQANAEHKDKPIDTGTRRLPAGIKNGIAKLQFMYTKEQTEDKKQVPKGESFFRASAVTLGKLVNGVLVKEHDGENIADATTSVVIPLCDIAPRADGKGGKTFSENWFEFQNLFKLLSNGSIVCQENAQTDPTGQKTEAFYFAAMAALTNPKHPIFVEFSTRGWTPPATSQKPKPEEMVFEEWHGLAHLPNGVLPQHNPAAGMTEGPPRHTTANFTPGEPPPPAPQTQTAPARAVAPPPVSGPPPPHQPGGAGNPAAAVAGLVEVAMAAPGSKTPDGAAATGQLEEMAWARGWTKEQTAGANSWEEVGNMALSDPAKTPLQEGVAAINNQPIAGKRFMYAKRTKEGVKYKDNKGAEFPTQECEVTSVNAEAKTCTLKTIHDGKEVVDLRTKKPVDVKFEWLENALPY